MADFPALPIWTDAILADCGYMSDEKFGAYHRLLYLIWRSPQCRIPNDDEWLAERLNKPVEVIRSLYRQFVTTDDQDTGEVLCRTDGNWIFQKRLIKEKNFLVKQSRKQSVRAKSRWNKEKDSCRGNATPGNAPTPTPTPPIEDTNVSSNPLPPKGGFVLPDWIPAAAWKAYAEMRVRIRKPMTDRAKELTINNLEKLKALGNEPGDVLEQSVQNSWQGVFPLRVNNKNHQASNQRRTYSDELIDAANMAINRLERKPSNEIY